MRRHSLLQTYLNSPYLLEGLHLLKGGNEFDLSKLLSSSTRSNATFSFSDNYSDVNIEDYLNGSVIIGKSLGSISLKNNGHVKYDNTIPVTQTPDSVIVKINVADSTNPAGFDIYIHITFHSGIDSTWLSPNKIEVCRNGFSHGFCVYVKFTDNTIIDITGQATEQGGYYWEFIMGSSSYLQWTNKQSIQSDGRFRCYISTNQEPTNNASKGISDAIEVHLPDYLKLASPFGEV